VVLQITINSQVGPMFVNLS